MRLEGQVAVVTGAAQGLGLQTARRLCEEGALTLIADLEPREENRADWPKEIRQRCRFRRTDVRQFDSVEETIEHAERECGPVDILVNTASIFSSLSRKPFEELTAEDWERSLSVNVLGTFHGTKAVFPHMKERGRGKIVNVASDAVFKGLPLLLDYVTAKGAVVAMTRALARELGPHNIRINAVAPGYTWHAEHEKWSDERNEQVLSLRCLQRTQLPDDVARAVLFLVSDDSDFVTGQTLVVDGGEVLR